MRVTDVIPSVDLPEATWVGSWCKDRCEKFRDYALGLI